MLKFFKRILFPSDYKQLKIAEENIQPYLSDQKKSDRLSIAFCISGHIRDYKRVIKNYKHFKNLINNYGDIDVFISTWNRQNTANCWSSAHGFSSDNSHLITVDQNDIVNNFEAINIDINNYDFYESLFSPLQYNIFTNKIYNWDLRGIHNGILGSTKMFYLIYRVNLLKLQQEYINNKCYDWVFRLRPDMEYNIDICDATIKLDSLDNNKLYVCPLNNDQFAFGGSTIMNKYSNTIMKISCLFDNDIFGDPETLNKLIYSDLIGDKNIVHISKCGSLKAEKYNCPIQLR